jgi:hypothetical protein
MCDPLTASLLQHLLGARTHDLPVSYGAISFTKATHELNVVIDRGCADH